MRPISTSGFTLIEALVVIALTAILVAYGVPSFRTFNAGRAVTAHVAELSGTLRLARAEAIKRGAPVTVCQTADPNAAEPQCANGADWSSGWLIFVDRGTQGAFDPGDVLVQAQNAVPNSGGIRRISGSAFITFLPTGVAQAAVDGRFCVRPPLPTGDADFVRLTRTVVVNSTGSTRLADGTGCPL